MNINNVKIIVFISLADNLVKWLYVINYERKEEEWAKDGCEEVSKTVNSVWW